MSKLSPATCLTIHAANVAALSAAFAPLFDNDPVTMGVNGFILGLVTGLPFYVAAMIHRSRR